MGEKLPIEIAREANTAEERGDLERAMQLHAQAQNPWKAAQFALQIGRPQQAFEYYKSAGDAWSAEKIALEHGISFEMHEPKYILGKNIEYSGDFSLVKLVHTDETAVSQSNAEFPIIGTFGIGPCVALATYHKGDKVGSISHFSVGVGVPESIRKVNTSMGNRLSDSEIYLVGDYSLQSEDLVDEIKATLGSVNIVEEDILCPEQSNGRSFLIDTRNGATYVFNPERHPNIEKRDPLSEMVKNMAADFYINRKGRGSTAGMSVPTLDIVYNGLRK